MYKTKDNLYRIAHIKKLIESKGLDIANTEKILGFSNGSIAKWVKNRPNIDNFYKLAEFLEVSMNYLYTGESETKNTNNNKYLKLEIEMDNIFEKANEKQKETICKIAKILIE